MRNRKNAAPHITTTISNAILTVMDENQARSNSGSDHHRTCVPAGLRRQHALAALPVAVAIPAIAAIMPTVEKAGVVASQPSASSLRPQR